MFQYHEVEMFSKADKLFQNFFFLSFYLLASNALLQCCRKAFSRKTVGRASYSSLSISCTLAKSFYHKNWMYVITINLIGQQNSVPCTNSWRAVGSCVLAPPPTGWLTGSTRCCPLLWGCSCLGWTSWYTWRCSINHDKSQNMSFIRQLHKFLSSKFIIKDNFCDDGCFNLFSHLTINLHF